MITKTTEKMTTTIKLIKEKDRLSFLPKFMSSETLFQFENQIYTAMENEVEGYDGGYYEFYEITSIDGKAPLLIWQTSREEVTVQGMFEDIKTNSFTASLAINSKVQSQMSFMLQGKDRERMVQQYYALRAWAMDAKDQRVDFAAYFKITD